MSTPCINGDVPREGFGNSYTSRVVPVVTLLCFECSCEDAVAGTTVGSDSKLSVALRAPYAGTRLVPR